MRARGLLFAIVLLAPSAGVRADATCDTIRSDLTGPQIYGQHTMDELSRGAGKGDCNAAAYLVRRARDARGFLAEHCPGDADLMTLAEKLVKQGEDELDTPECQN